MLRLRTKLKVSGSSRDEIYTKAIKAIAAFYGISEEEAENYSAEVEVESTDYDHDRHYVGYVYCSGK